MYKTETEIKNFCESEIKKIKICDLTPNGKSFLISLQIGRYIGWCESKGWKTDAAWLERMTIISATVS